jgi:hypothetical protein
MRGTLVASATRHDRDEFIRSDYARQNKALWSEISSTTAANRPDGRGAVVFPSVIPYNKYQRCSPALDAGQKMTPKQGKRPAET